MEISDLKEFIALAKCLSFIAAADECFVSQSTLSKHIKRLEKEVGYTLFLRNSSKVKLSSYGQLLLPYAEQIVAAEETSRKVLREHEAKIHESLSVGSTTIMVPYQITSTISGFHQMRPDSSVNIVEGETAELVELLREKKLNLAFLLTGEEEKRQILRDNPDLNWIVYRRDCLCVVSAKSHTLAGKDHIALHELKNEPFIFWPTGTAMYDRCYHACTANYFAPNIVLSAPRSRSIIELVSHEMGISIMPLQQALCANNPDVTATPITPEMPIHVSLVHFNDSRLTSIERDFIDYLNKTVGAKSQE